MAGFMRGTTGTVSTILVRGANRVALASPRYIHWLFHGRIKIY